MHRTSHKDFISTDKLLEDFKKPLYQLCPALSPYELFTSSLQELCNLLPTLDESLAIKAIARVEDRLRTRFCGESGLLRQILQQQPEASAQIIAFKKLEEHLLSISKQLQRGVIAHSSVVVTDGDALAEELFEEVRQIPWWLRKAGTLDFFESFDWIQNKLEPHIEDLNDFLQRAWEIEVMKYATTIRQRCHKLVKDDLLQDIQRWSELTLAPLQTTRQGVNHVLKNKIWAQNNLLDGRYRSNDFQIQSRRGRNHTASVHSDRDIPRVKSGEFAREQAIQQVLAQLDLPALENSIRLRGITMPDGTRCSLEELLQRSPSAIVQACSQLVREQLHLNNPLEGGFACRFLNSEELGGDLTEAIERWTPRLGAFLHGTPGWEDTCRIGALIAEQSGVLGRDWHDRLPKSGQGAFLPGAEPNMLTFVGIFCGLYPGGYKSMPEAFSAYLLGQAPKEQDLRCTEPGVVGMQDGNLVFQELRPMHVSPGGRQLPEIYFPQMSNIQTERLFELALQLDEIKKTKDGQYYAGRIHEVCGTKEDLLEKLKTCPNFAGELVVSARRRAQLLFGASAGQKLESILQSPHPIQLALPTPTELQ